MQAIITELVFEHALRIRMKAETSGNAVAGDGNAPTAVATPDNASRAEGSSDVGDTDDENAAHSAEPSTATAVAADSAKGKGKGKDTESTASAKEAAPKPEEKKSPGKNLIGRINNLVSSDLTSLDFSSMHIVFAST